MQGEHKLQRQNAVIAGVCGGLGEYFGVKPLWFRIGFLLFTLPGGVPGPLLYLVLWVLVPKR
ncbi:MAG: PspC domain-containing protein [Chloroflexi bacterium]|nr:PspC domain-containing protein [Chloroflexota bacterium]